jgi:hypothetical protein
MKLQENKNLSKKFKFTLCNRSIYPLDLVVSVRNRTIPENKILSLKFCNSLKGVLQESLDIQLW